MTGPFCAGGFLRVVVVIAAVGVVSSVAGIDDRVTAAGLAVAALLWLAVLGLRRERRIRARLADPRTRPLARPPATAPMTRVGPGDPSPASPAPIAYPGPPRDTRPARSAAPTGGLR